MAKWVIVNGLESTLGEAKWVGWVKRISLSTYLLILLLEPVDICVMVVAMRLFGPELGASCDVDS